MDDWKKIQDDLRNNCYGDWEEIRNELCETESRRHPGQGISSSDINHMAYGAVKSGELERVKGN